MEIMPQYCQISMKLELMLLCKCLYHGRAFPLVSEINEISPKSKFFIKKKHTKKSV